VDGLPAVGEDWASSVCVFGGDLDGSFVQAAARQSSKTTQAATKLRNRVVFIVPLSYRTFGPTAVGVELRYRLPEVSCLRPEDELQEYPRIPKRILHQCLERYTAIVRVCPII
jgi:hypothetical protein